MAVLATTLISGCLSGAGGVNARTSATSTASIGEPASIVPTPSPTVTSSPTPLPSPGNRRVTVSWAASLESGVNRAGGGYRISYSTAANFPAGSTGSLVVPYVSGARAPTSATITGLSSGQYFIRVASFSSIVSPVTNQASVSDHSASITVQVP